MKFLQTYSVVDENLRILWVGGEWDEFALDNQGHAAVSNQVLSTRIIDHIVGQDTRDAVVSLITAVLEEQHPLTLDYRCDSPYQLRRFQLTVKPMKEHRVLMVHDLRDAQHFEHPHPHVHYRHDATASKCSFCNSVREAPDGPWIASETMKNHPAAVNYLVCQTCADNIAAAIAATRANQKLGKPVVNGFGP